MLWEETRGTVNFINLFICLLSAVCLYLCDFMMPLAKQTALMGLDNWVGVVILYVVFYMPMNVLLYSGYLVNIPTALEEAAGWMAQEPGALTGRSFSLL